MGRSRTTPSSFALTPEAASLPEPLIARAELGELLQLNTLFQHADGGFDVELEIGFGKGRFLLEEARTHPATRFIGIEHAAPYARFVRHKVLLAGLSNVRLIAADARDLLRRRILPERAFTQVHILFPDPWPKRRHNKRRIIQTPFLDDVAHILRTGGNLNVATDHPGYAPHICQTIDAHPAFERQPAFALDGDIAARSHFGVRYASHDGHRIQAITWKCSA